MADTWFVQASRPAQSSSVLGQVCDSPVFRFGSAVTMLALWMPSRSMWTLTAHRLKLRGTAKPAQQPTAHTVPAPRQPTPVLLVRPRRRPQLLPENPVLLDQIRECFLPLVVPPARKSHQQ